MVGHLCQLCCSNTKTMNDNIVNDIKKMPPDDILNSTKIELACILPSAFH